MIQDIWLIKRISIEKKPVTEIKQTCARGIRSWRGGARLVHNSSRGPPLLDARCLMMFNLKAQVSNRNYPHVNIIFSFQGNAYRTHNKLRVSVSSSCYQVKNSSDYSEFCLFIEVLV